MSQPPDFAQIPVDICPTMQCLMALGFSERKPDYSHFKLGFKLATVELDAQEMVNFYFASIVQVSGILKSPRILAIIDIQLPRNLCSTKEVAAWLVFGLEGKQRDLGSLPAWWSLGEASLDLHPIVQQRKAAQERALAYRKRPHCVLAGDHARIFRRELRESILQLDTGTNAVVTFNGQVLSVEIAGDCVRGLARGESWPISVMWPISNDMILPARFRSPAVEVGYFEGKLDFDAVLYPAKEF